jgi:clan AA aspartic protease (TIGR02281 family)
MAVIPLCSHCPAYIDPLNFKDEPMKKLLSICVLYSGTVIGDPNIYGPGGVNLGPDGNPELLFQEIEQQERKNNDENASASELVLHPQRNGHYFVDGSINDLPLKFVIDTGASAVSLPRETAFGAGIYCENDIEVNTANGKVPACTGKIQKLKFGDFTLTDVACMIIPSLDQALLGNNVLVKFKMIQNNGEIRISNK